MWNNLKLDFAIFRNNVLSCSHSIILFSSKLIFIASSSIFFNSFLFSFHIIVVSSAYASILKYLDVCCISFM